ncbi:MAG: hypothetical protein JWR08_439 [Enterovirga sp.]|jgi:hypothetical protein|nr:hypothetical protein [Enterovirga sp.]
MDETVRNVAWSIAEAWWRKRNRVAAGSVPEANSSTEYADNFWQGWVEEAQGAVACMGKMNAARAAGEPGCSAAIARI